jgi:hypothetical protein
MKLNHNEYGVAGGVGSFDFGQGTVDGFINIVMKNRFP